MPGYVYCIPKLSVLKKKKLQYQMSNNKTATMNSCDSQFVGDVLQKCNVGLCIWTRKSGPTYIQEARFESQLHSKFPANAHQEALGDDSSGEPPTWKTWTGIVAPVFGLAHS